MVQLECYIAESYRILLDPESTRKDHLLAFEKLCMQYGELCIATQSDLISNYAERLIRIIVLLDLLKMKLS